MTHISQKQKGFGVVEIVIGAALISIVMFGLAASFQVALKLSRDTSHKTQAQFLLEEGVEAVRLMRDDAWAHIGELATSTPYYLVFSAGSFATSTTPVLIDGVYDRTVVLSDVYRDGNDDIAPAGTLDSSTKKVSVSVGWLSGGATTTKEVATYLSQIF